MTKEEILDKLKDERHDVWALGDHLDYFDGYASTVLNAMEAYSDQQNKELKEIVLQLQKDFVLKIEEIKNINQHENNNKT